jgi:hypothetical protein
MHGSGDGSGGWFGWIKEFESNHPRAYAALLGPLFAISNFLVLYFFGEPVPVSFLILISVGFGILLSLATVFLIPKFRDRKRRSP